MTITRNVVRDLLVVYQAGEACAETRAIVEEWLRTDPELAAEASHAMSAELPSPGAPAATGEKRALDRVKRLLRWRMVLLGIAIYVTTLPLSITFNSSGYSGLLIDNWPERIIILVIAAVLWAAWWRLSRAVRVTGL